MFPSVASGRNSVTSSTASLGARGERTRTASYLVRFPPASAGLAHSADTPTSEQFSRGPMLAAGVGELAKTDSTVSGRVGGGTTTSVVIGSLHGPGRSASLAASLRPRTCGWVEGGAQCGVKGGGERLNT